MAEYIEREKIFPNGVFLVNKNDPLTSFGELINRINNIPAADVVEVVRCRDCKYREKLRYDSQYHCCNENAGMAYGVKLNGNDFCSYGERRGEDA